VGAQPRAVHRRAVLGTARRQVMRRPALSRSRCSPC
jgi:hypothetical protein